MEPLCGRRDRSGGHGAQARVIIDEQGVPLVALLTIPSLQDLDLGVRAGVHVSFKAFAVHLC